jgi:uncharacterized protein
VQIRSRDIAGLGKFLDALVAAGGNQIDGPNFTLDKPEPLIAQARAKAVATAQANADALARAAGFKRARLLSIGEANTARPVVMMREQAFDSSVAKTVSAPIAPGEVSTSVTLTGSYRLEN